MDTSRAQINYYDNSTTYVEEPTALTGFTVVRAPKGPVTPVKISKGGAARIKDIFGVSSKEYPELFEVETFNKEYDVYVSAPYNEARVPVAYVTGNGIHPSSETVRYEPGALEKIVFGDDEGISVEGITKIGDSGVEALYDIRYPKLIDNSADTLDLKTYGYPKWEEKFIEDVFRKGVYVYTGLTSSQITTKQLSKVHIEGPLSWDIKISSEKLYVTVGNTDYEVGCTDTYSVDSKDYVALYIYGEPKYGHGEGITDGKYYTTLTDEFVQNNLNEDSERKSLTISWVNKLEDDEIYAVIFPKYPSSRPLHISFASFSEIDNYSSKSWKDRNILKMTVFEEGAYRDAGNSIYVMGSLDSKAVDGNGAPIGFTKTNSLYSGQDLIHVYVRKAFDSQSIFNKNITSYPSIVLSGGERDVIGDSIELHNKGWEEASENEFSDVDIFFDSSLHTGEDKNTLGKSKFFTMATDDVASHELAGYIFNKTVAPEDVWVNNKLANDAASLKLTFGKNYWNICNEAIIEDTSNGTRFTSPMTGAKALMQCRILEKKRGGVAPEFLNEGDPGMGGQLNMIDVYKLKYKYNKKVLDILDALNYNPVINDRQYGTMVTGHKTCKEGDVTDWSYIGHASAFFNFLKQVRENVMIPQIGKPNNPYYRNLRKEQVDVYLAERLNGSDRIWAWAECDTSTADGVNDVYALKARKFVIKVRVRVDVFSEDVVLNFINEDQDSKISIE